MDRITIIEGEELERLMSWLSAILDNRQDIYKIRACQDGNTLKLKINEGAWSAPLGDLDPSCAAARDNR